MASVTARPLLRSSSICWTAIFLAWPVLCRAGVGSTAHDLHPHNEERNCTLCHSPHAGEPQKPLWMMPRDEPAAGNKTIYFTPSTEQNVICLSCHDGVLAEDMYMVLSPGDEEDLDISGIKRYYNSGGTLFFSACEKHYNLASYYRKQLPGQRLECTTCHDIHLKNDDSRKADLISSDVYFKHKICLICHKTGR